MEILTIQPFLQYFGNVRERTLRVARCIPADKIEWTYAAGKFTLGDLAPSPGGHRALHVGGKCSESPEPLQNAR